MSAKSRKRYPAMILTMMTTVLTSHVVAQDANKQEELKQQAGSLRELAAKVVASTPDKHGPERLKKLNEAIDLLEKAKSAIDQSNTKDTLRAAIHGELASAHMRIVIAQDGVNRLLEAAEKLDGAEDALNEAEIARRKASGEAAIKAARQAVEAAQATRDTAAKDLEEIREHAAAAHREFRHTVDLMRQSPDPRLGPGSDFIKGQLFLQAHLLQGEQNAKERELELLKARLEPKVKQ